MDSISIITPWLDHPEFISDYENAVRAAEVEVIVVDNGSSAPNAALQSQMITRLGGQYLRNEENRWFSAANNQGLAVARGGIIVFLNNDIAARGPWLDQVQADVKAAALYGPVLFKDFVINGKPAPYHEGWCVAGIREVWDQLGGWDAEAHSMPYWEDRDLGFRAASVGIELVQTQWPLHHKGKGTTRDVPGVRLGYNRVRQNYLSRTLGHDAGGAVLPPEGRTVTLQYAQRLHQEAFLPEAERAYRTVLEKEPLRADAWAGYASVLHLSGRHDAALEAFRRAAELQPDASHWLNMGAVLGRCGRLDESVECLRKAIKLAPESAEAYANLARALVGLSRFEEAATAARRSLVLRPGFMNAQVMLGKSLVGCGRVTEAVDVAHSAVRENPHSYHAFNLLGEVLRASGRLVEALAAYEHSLRLEPGSTLAAESRVQLLSVLGRDPK